MKFRKIDKSNYWDCMALTIAENQEGFVAGFSGDADGEGAANQSMEIKKR